MKRRMFTRIGDLSQNHWDPVTPTNFPFFDYDFLVALERHDCLGERTGWFPRILTLWEERGNGQGDEKLIGALCLFEKWNSLGEYIFDWDWARAHELSGERYYPKLVSAVPFTPATGPKLLVRPDVPPSKQSETRQLLVRWALEIYDAPTEAGPLASSLHALFLLEDETQVFAEAGFFIRHSFQFHWRNRGYGSFEDFLEDLTKKRRKEIRRERRQVADAGIGVEVVTGEELFARDGASMWDFYESTLDKKQGLPYLTPGFFEEIFSTMKDRIVLARAYQDSRVVAASLSLHKGRHLYGRYWGSLQEIKSLHFELCFYQLIDYGIRCGVDLIEAGAQGPHKWTRGFLPELTLSAHKIRSPRMDGLVRDFVHKEAERLDAELAEAERSSPFRSSR